MFDICREISHSLMDLFSTRANMKLPIYVSPFPDLLVREEDAFQHQWDKLSVCVFTSFTLLRQFLSRGKLSCNLSMNLVAPFWSQKGVVCTSSGSSGGRTPQTLHAVEPAGATPLKNLHGGWSHCVCVPGNYQVPHQERLIKGGYRGHR